ncbi:MAG: ROK family protein [Patescibacteria group bacterium]
MAYTICCDIGGTKINTGLVKNNRVISHHKILTEKKKGLKRLLANIKKSITNYQPQKARAIGLSFAGPVNNGVVLEATNFPAYIRGVNLKKILESWYKKPVFVEHDGLCFTLSESILGAGKKYQYIIGVTIGTGIGGGFVVDKKLYRGRQNLMEMGHFQIREGGFRCSCGHYGHFESQVCGPALSKYYRRITGQTLKGEEINHLALRGDKNALAAAEVMARYLAQALASLANTLSPDIFILGGGVSRFEKIIALAKKDFGQEVIYARHKTIKIVKSDLEDNALLLGADLLTNNIY